MRGDASECFVRYAANYLKVERCAAKARRLGQRELRSRAAADHLASPDHLKARLKVTCFARYSPQTRRSSSDEYGFSPLCKAGTYFRRRLNVIYGRRVSLIIGDE